MLSLPSFCSTFHVESFPTNPYSLIWISYEEVSTVCFYWVGFRVVWTGKRSFFTVLTVVMVFTANHWKSEIFVQYCNDTNLLLLLKIDILLFFWLGKFQSKAQKQSGISLINHRSDPNQGPLHIATFLSWISVFESTNMLNLKLPITEELFLPPKSRFWLWLCMLLFVFAPNVYRFWSLIIPGKLKLNDKIWLCGRHLDLNPIYFNGK